MEIARFDMKMLRSLFQNMYMFQQWTGNENNLIDLKKGYSNEFYLKPQINRGLKVKVRIKILCIGGRWVY